MTVYYILLHYVQTLAKSTFERDLHKIEHVIEHVSVLFYFAKHSFESRLWYRATCKVHAGHSRDFKGFEGDFRILKETFQCESKVMLR